LPREYTEFVGKRKEGKGEGWIQLQEEVISSEVAGPRKKPGVLVTGYYIRQE